MSNRMERARSSLWLVRRIDGTDWRLFSGSVHEMCEHISRLHRKTGIQHAAREVGASPS
jgi:hypothetical protein